MSAQDGQLTQPDARFDLYAAGLSTLCLLHCLALPALVTLMPLATRAAESELMHQILAICAAPLSLLAVWRTLAIKVNKLYVGGALTGIALLLAAAFIEALASYEEPITVVGGVLLCSAHVTHWMQQRRAQQRDTRGLAAEPEAP